MLRRVSTDPSSPRKGRRAQIVLAAADGLSNSEIASCLGCSLPTVSKWRRRFADKGLVGLADEVRPGRPSVFGEAKVQQIVAWTLSPSAEEARWTTRYFAQTLGVSRATVYRVRKRFHLPCRRRIEESHLHRTAIAKPPTKLAGLHLLPPQTVAALCSTHAHLPSESTRRPLRHKGEDHGETPGALDLNKVREHLYAAAGTACRLSPGKRKEEVLAFLRRLEATYRTGEIRLVAYNAPVLDLVEVRRWLDRRPRFDVQHVPTKSDWVRRVVSSVPQKAFDRQRLTRSLVQHGSDPEMAERSFEWVDKPAQFIRTEQVYDPCG